RLHTIVRRIDTVARLGGDEFVLLMPHVGPGDVAEVARRVLSLCAEPFALDGHRLTVTPSIGISLFPEDGRDFGTLLKNADTAMYKAKEQGRNNFHFYATEMNIATLERLLLESNLRQALARGEFRLHYQPLVTLKNGRIVGAEALLRWQHPDLGMVPPTRFIPVAEDTGLINTIGDWVLQEACRQARDWQRQGLEPITMAVNVSPVQFRQRDFLGVVARALEISGLDPACLELELTEGTVMHDAEANLGIMTALQAMKIDLAVDDFGTGYSSLAYLKRFPVGKLKIDQSFIRDIVDDADDLAIASTIISMGHSLRLQVLAEGVENGDQLARMIAHGCDLAQG
ncbi:MAG TPA: bifunctional diguanylate cyclase/phosphodiesterase, partial [Rhodocyclaceae bacterium]|nr:bifunctional diguanylate cyclase/phosphodiesterase [Rhodocyclaceae bacterium]